MSASRLRAVLIAAVILGYVLLRHISNAAGAPPELGAALALAPLLLAVLLLAWRTPWSAVMLPLVLLGAAVVVLRLWSPLEHRFARVYVLEQCGLYLTLASHFGRTLLPGQVPLCTRWATLVHGALAPQASRYTRGVTVAWTVFFMVVAALSATLYAIAPRTAWSVFSNFLILPSAVVLFAAEYSLRRRQLPFMPRASFAAMWRVYWAYQPGSRRL